MAEHDGLVDLGLAEPGVLVAARKDLDRDRLAAPRTAPDFAESAIRKRALTALFVSWHVEKGPSLATYVSDILRLTVSHRVTR